jgi:signal transduction histidine kinase
MRRPSLSTKLLAAAVPLLIAIGALLFVTVRNDLDTVNDAERSAQLGAVWSPMVDALSAVDAERDLATADALDAAAGTESAGASAVPEGAEATLASTAEATLAARTATDDAIAAVRASIEALSENPAAVAHLTAARSSLSTARRNIDMAAANMIATTEPLAAYGVASSELVSVARLLPPAAGSPALGRQLLAVQKVAESNLAAGQVIAGVNQFTADPTSPNALISARNSLDQLESALNEFAVIAPDEWVSQFRRSGMTIGFASFRIDVDRALRATDITAVEPIDVDAFSTLITEGNNFQREISSSIVEQAEADAAETRRSTLIRIGIIGGAVALAMLVTWFVTRSIAKRVRAVAKAANQVATRQLPTLVHAMRDPKGRELPTIDPVDAKGSDELAELAESFNTMQRTLVSVAEEQVAVLRKGVSDIFINMARRNRSLVDRQLAMLDSFEAQVDDPDVLANYYQLDHLATRMRRNAESLLVLANEEPRRRRVGPTDVDNVVRASIGEIEDYRRIQVEHLDSMKVRGNVVADIAHLFAELLDNAAQFSPPNSTVRVGGRRTPGGYTVRINDAGVGIVPDRLEELNELLRNPPIVGLSVEPTLGMSVVSLLAAKHGIKVTLMAGAPGLTVDVELPNTVSADVPEPVSDTGGAGFDSAEVAGAGTGVAGVTMIPVVVTAAAAAAAGSTGLRIDEDVVAQFTAGQGPEMTSASVNNLAPPAEPFTAGINGYGTHDHHDAPASDDTTFVMPESFGNEDTSYGISDIAALGNAGHGASPAGGTVGAGNTFAMPDETSIEAALAAAAATELANADHFGDRAGNANTFAMPDEHSIETVLASNPTPGAYVNDDVHDDASTPGIAGQGNTFAMPDQHSIETALTGNQPATGASDGADATADEESNFSMPDVAPERPVYARIDPYRTETAADAAEREDATYAIPGLFDSGAHTPVVTGPAPTLTPAAEPATEPAMDPMFRPVVLAFGGGEPSNGTTAASGNADHLDHPTPTQLDRPNITARLTDAFQRSHLTHTTPVAGTPRTAPSPDQTTAQPEPVGQHGVSAPTYPSQRPAGEFSRPMSPPVSPAGPTSQPVTPADAYPAPPIVSRPPLASSLPTRRAAEVDGGHDRMADLPSTVNAKRVDEEANALAAALAAFDRRLENHHAANGNGAGNGNGLAAPSARISDGPALPTRSPAAVTAPMSDYDQMPESTTTSRLDPEQLRERLRSFQTGVRGAVATDEAPTTTHNADHGDHR